MIRALRQLMGRGRLTEQEDRMLSLGCAVLQILEEAGYPHWSEYTCRRIATEAYLRGLATSDAHGQFVRTIEAHELSSSVPVTKPFSR